MHSEETDKVENSDLTNKVAMKFFAVLIFSVFVISTGTALKCHRCIDLGSLPSNIIDHLNSMNISLNDLNITDEAGNCKSTDDYCSNGTWCAKKAFTYKINFSGIKFNYNTAYKTCVNQRSDTNEQPEDGHCYESASEVKTYEGGITRKVQWCYCKNKDFCNSSTRELFSFGLIATVLIIIRSL